MKCCFIPILLVFIFIGNPSGLHSQDTTSQKRSEVSFDFASVFRSGITPTFTYRYHFNKSAFRLKVSPTLDLELGKHDKTTTGTVSNIITESTQNSSYGFTVGLGYERQLKAGKVWFYYGADLLYKDNSALTYVKTNKKDIDSTGAVTNDSDSESDISTRTTRIGPAGLIGARFFLHPRCALSLETGLAIFYRSYISTRRGTGGEIKEQTKNKGLEVSWTPALINLSWFF